MRVCVSVRACVPACMLWAERTGTFFAELYDTLLPLKRNRTICHLNSSPKLYKRTTTITNLQNTSFKVAHSQLQRLSIRFHHHEQQQQQKSADVCYIHLQRRCCFALRATVYADLRPLNGFLFLSKLGRIPR